MTSRNLAPQRVSRLLWRPFGAVAGTIAVASMVFGCSGSDSATTTTVTTVAVLQAPVVENNFCEQMTKIRIAAVQSDGPVDRDGLIAEYQTALSLAPDDVKPDLEDLILLLQSEPVGSATTTDPGEVDSGDAEGEGWQPASDPAGRVFDYVDIYCLGTAANPGPAATPPP